MVVALALVSVLEVDWASLSDLLPACCALACRPV
jgi:hypothetical protein